MDINKKRIVATEESINQSKINEVVRGKVVEKIEDYSRFADDFIGITFSDGTKLEIRYDYIYDWTLFVDTKKQGATGEK